MPLWGAGGERASAFWGRRQRVDFVLGPGTCTLGDGTLGRPSEALRSTDQVNGLFQAALFNQSSVPERWLDNPYRYPTLAASCG